MDVVFRKATPEDVSNCIILRGKTRENAFSAEQLAAIGVTLESWRSAISDDLLIGYVCFSEEQMVGYCFGNQSTGEIVVLALLPEYEGKGIGKILLNLVIESLKELDFHKLFLGCSSDPKARSYGFYRHLGWRSTGTFDNSGDELLEYSPS